MEKLNDWKTRTLIFGAIIGLITGIIAAYLMVQRAEQEESKPTLNARDGVKLGVGVMTLLRQVAELGMPK